MPLHIAITRRVRPGCEAAFQAALLEFFQSSFTQPGVLGASMLTPPPGSDSPEYGILRTFSSEAERDAFYESPLYLAWAERARPLTEGEPIIRQLHGLEAWFRAPLNPPPRWKMALATLLGVYPTSLVLTAPLHENIHTWPLWARSLNLAVCMVALLTWLVMPLVIRLLKPWLHPLSQTKGNPV